MRELLLEKVQKVRLKQPKHPLSVSNEQMVAGIVTCSQEIYLEPKLWWILRPFIQLVLPREPYQREL